MPKKLKINFKEPVCKRCGRCCYILTKDNGWQPCPYLVLGTDKDPRATCTIYNRPDRKGTPIGFGYICAEFSMWNIPGCPFNSFLKRSHPYWRRI